MHSPPCSVFFFFSPPPPSLPPSVCFFPQSFFCLLVSHVSAAYSGIALSHWYRYVVVASMTMSYHRRLLLHTPPLVSPCCYPALTARRWHEIYDANYLPTGYVQFNKLTTSHVSLWSKYYKCEFLKRECLSFSILINLTRCFKANEYKKISR